MANVTLAMIDKKIATFSTNRKVLQSLGHEIAMMILRHAAPKEVSDDCSGSGDCTRALALAEQMPASWAAQLEQFFKLNSPIIVVTKNKKVGFDPAYKKLTAEEKLLWWKLDLAAQNPFFEATGPVPKDKDLLDLAALIKMVEALGNRIEKQVEGHKVVEGDVASALDVAHKLKGLKIKRIKPDATNENAAGPVGQVAA